MDEPLHNDNAFILQRYLDGEMTNEESDALRNRLREDASLRQELHNMQMAIQAIKQYGTTQKVTAIHSEMMQELKSQQKGKIISVSKSVRYTLAVAASILVLFVGVRIYLNMQSSPENLYNETFVDFNLSATRGNEGILSQVEKLYQQKNYEGVTSTARSRSLSAKDSLLIGLSYLHTGKNTQAILFFQQLAQATNDFRQDAEFYLSLAYLKDQNFNSALQWMKKINSDPAHLYHEQIDKELIQKLTSLTN
ncbi:MAG TPA: hypothetical protein VGB71_02390 [Flavisolibacter sp.]